MAKQGKAVVCLSGGLDSCVTTAIAAREYELALFHVNYGQRTEVKELACFHAIADYYGVKTRLVTDLPLLRDIGMSSLTDPSLEIPDGKVDRGDVPNTYVPFRNAILLSLAVAWAEAIGAKAVFMGATEVESLYPDCQFRFICAMQEAVKFGAKHPPSIIVPLVNMTKADVVRKGIELGAPLHLTWSCYRNSDIACGHCHSCLLRLKGFAEAGIVDPIPYERLPEFVAGR